MCGSLIDPCQFKHTIRILCVLCTTLSAGLICGRHFPFSLFMCLQPTVSAGLLIFVACSTVPHSLTRISLLASGFGEDPGGPWYHHMLAHQAEPQPASSPVFPHLFPLLPRCVPRHTGAQVCPPPVLDDSLSTPLPPLPALANTGAALRATMSLAIVPLPIIVQPQRRRVHA